MITTCHEVCVSNVIWEGDSAMIMKALQSDEVSLALNDSLIEDVKDNYSIGCFLNYVSLVFGVNVIRLLIV